MPQNPVAIRKASKRPKLLWISERSFRDLQTVRFVSHREDVLTAQIPRSQRRISLSSSGAQVFASSFFSVGVTSKNGTLILMFGQFFKNQFTIIPLVYKCQCINDNTLSIYEIRQDVNHTYCFPEIVTFVSPIIQLSVENIKQYMFILNSDVIYE